jgi:hypothetical protein
MSDCQMSWLIGGFMATMFRERERAFEAKFAHDEEFRFLVGARRDRLFAEWAAEMLGLSREEGDALVKAVHRIPNGPGHDQALLQHIYDLTFQRLGETFRGDASAALARCAEDARQQVLIQERFS